MTYGPISDDMLNAGLTVRGVAGDSSGLETPWINSLREMSVKFDVMVFWESRVELSRHWERKIGAV